MTDKIKPGGNRAKDIELDEPDDTTGKTFIKPSPLEIINRAEWLHKHSMGEEQ